jgi:glycosyltransferase involved in cell wall biosynthesis
MGSNVRVIISHPARQAIVYHRPMGAERMGINVTFLTGIYYKPNRFPYFLARWAPARIRKQLLDLLELRRIAGLSASNVVTIGGPLLECFYRAGIVSLQRWWNLWDWLAARWIQLCGGIASKDRPTIVHCFTGCGLQTLRAARSRNMTRVLEVTLPPVLADKDQMTRWGVSEFNFPDVANLKMELAEADFVLVQSEFGATTVRELGYPASRVLRIHLGVDTDKFCPRAGIRRPGPLRVIFVGQIDRRKGVHHLVQSWRELRLRDAELLLAGNTDSAPLELLTAIQETPRCKLLGHVREQRLISLYQDADMLVHPSLAEGACAAIYEALGCGVPCIVSSHSTSAVRSGIEGIVFPAGDIESLKAAILKLYGDPTLRHQMAGAARDRAEKSLSLSVFSREIAGIYRGLAEISVGGAPNAVFESSLTTDFWGTVEASECPTESEPVRI